MCNYSIRNSLSIFLLFISYLLFAPTAQSSDHHTIWEGAGITLSGPPTSTSVELDGTNGQAEFNYTNLPLDGICCGSGEWEFSTVSEHTGSVHLTYDYTGHHAFFQVRVSLEAFVIQGETTIVYPLVNDGPSNCPPCLPPSAGFEYIGTVSIPVKAGERYGFRMTGSNADSNATNTGTLEVGVEIEEQPEELGEAVLLQALATPEGDKAAVTLRATGLPGLTLQTIELLTSSVCFEGELGEDVKVFAEIDIGEFDSNGEAFLYALVETSNPVSTYASARIRGGEIFGGEEFEEEVFGSEISGSTSNCIIAGADNDSWVRALPLTLENESTSSTAVTNVSGFLDSPAKSRWYKFSIQPGARATVELNSLPDDYDLFVFKDISQAFKDLVGDTDVAGLNKLSAEFAPSVFSPSVFSPSVFSPSVFSPDAYAPSVFSPSVFSPSVFSPSVFSPSVFSPSVFSPSVFSPSVFSPSVFSPSVFSPSVFSPSVFSPSVFSGENFASAQSRSILAVSAQTGKASELVVADTWNNTGDFYVRVSGKNGASNIENPFQLAVRLDGVNCTGVVPINVATSAPANDYETIILWDSSRITSDPSNSATDITKLRSRLDAFAARAEIKGILVDLNDFGHIQTLHQQADEFSSCPYAENLTANAIKEIIDAYRQANTKLTYVVIAGSDSHVPFFRYPDQALLGPEQDYDPPVADGTQSQSSLRLNYILGQDEYGASTILSFRDGSFPLPDLAVGRLVETAAEMNIMLDAYLSTANGVIDQPTSTLVTGYDFLTDAANEVQFELVAGTNAARNDTLITAADISPDDPRSWTADDLRRELIEEGEDIVFLAGHFSANSTLAADYKTTALTTELLGTDVDFTNSIIFSAGCHSGYNIVDGDAVPGVTETLDWTQAFAQKGATLIAGTGYQYGDTDFVEYSERLYVSFARELRTGLGPVSVGQALVRAKQKYLSDTPDVRGLHRKSLLISTVFGLPMLKVDLSGERIVAPSDSPSINPVAVIGNPGALLGLKVADLPLTFTSAADGAQVENNVVLNNLEGGVLNATYFKGPNGVVSNPAEPAIPLLSRNVSVAGQPLSLRGIAWRSGSWQESDVLPLTGAPTTELRGVHTPFTSLVNFPMRLATVNYFGALTGGGTVLHVTPAQHRVNTVGDFDAVIRQFSDLGFRLYYSDNTQTYALNKPYLAGPPTLSGIKAEIDGADIIFTANVVGYPAAGIQNVWVTYTEGSESSGEWVSLDLTQTPNKTTQWTARLAGASDSFTRLDYVVQAVSGTGLVTMSDNYGGYYKLAGNLGEVGSDGQPEERIATQLMLTGDSTGIYGETQTFEATLSADLSAIADASILFTIGSVGRAARTDENGLASVAMPLTGLPGNYRLTASYAGNNIYEASASEQDFELTKTDTSLTLLNTPPVVEVDGVQSGLAALLQNAAGTPLLQRTVYFIIEGGPAGPITVAKATDKDGKAHLGSLALPAGSYDVTVRFLPPNPTGNTSFDDPLYNPSSNITVLELPNGEGCPAESLGKKSKKLDLNGFCYLTEDYADNIFMLDGTLVVGNGVSTKKKIIQNGAGSVRVLQGALVKSKIIESGPGSIFVAGIVKAKLQESGPGGIEVSRSGRVDNKIDEEDDGNLIVSGLVDGKVTENGKGDLIIRSTGIVTSHAREYGLGSLINDGVIEGKSSQQD